ncbi:MAG: cupin domain-containing protein [Chthonomonadaceae bacterium]|nr:cupin domain-containing protein [Chthonomonadaceae bacterium]
MAVLRVPDKNQEFTDYESIKSHLAKIGIGYEVWKPAFQLDHKAEAQDVLNAFADQIKQLKEEGGYVAADVIDLFPDTPNLDTMLAKFSREHWHDEDEVRFIIKGRGVFHIRPNEGDVVALEVAEGDLARVPAGTWHWFDLCQEKRIRAIRLFQDPNGWTPHYTNSGVDKGYLPVCMGLSFIPPQLAHL